MMYDIDRWRANMILEALHTLQEKWQRIVDSTDDEDVKADYGNDMLRLGVLRDGFTEKAVKEFGPGTTNFSHEPVQSATPASTNGAPVHPR